MTFNKQQFKDDLMIIRNKRNFSRAMVEREVGVSVSTMQTIEEGRFMPNINNFLKLCKWMGIPPTIYFLNN
jgi:DNA-binding XRE family transcriptional regulator